MSARAVALAAALLAAMPGAAMADTFREAEAAAAQGDCETAAPLYETVLAGDPPVERQIAAAHALAICKATPEEVWRSRELMSELLPVVMQHYGPQSQGLARHHAIWSEVEVRAGALNVAWRRSEAAIAAARAAGKVDPFDHAAELYRLAAIQHARGVGDAFLAFLNGERARLRDIDWAAEGDDELFLEVIGDPPDTGNREAFAAWVRMGLEELDPRPVYLGLLDDTPS
jgi:hypothetical protein